MVLFTLTLAGNQTMMEISIPLVLVSSLSTLTSSGMDFDTGERVYNYPLGDGIIHSTFGVSNQLGPSGELYVGDFLGLLAIYPDSTEL